MFKKLFLVSLVLGTSLFLSTKALKNANMDINLATLFTMNGASAGGESSGGCTVTINGLTGSCVSSTNTSCVFKYTENGVPKVIVICFDTKIKT